MKLTIKNLRKNKELVNRIGSVFYDLLLQDYEILDKKLVLYFDRPCFGNAKRNNLLYFIPRWEVPYIRTRIEISPINIISKPEKNSWDTGDWFRNFEFSKNSKMLVEGLQGKCLFNINNETCIKIEDIGKPYWGVKHMASKSYIDKNIEFFDKVMSKLNKQNETNHKKP